eukprot:5941871-Amphidinium_carterae.1
MLLALVRHAILAHYVQLLFTLHQDVREGLCYCHVASHHVATSRSKQAVPGTAKAQTIHNSLHMGATLLKSALQPLACFAPH